MPNLCKDKWTDVGCEDRKETTKFNGRNAGTDCNNPRLAHRWPIGTQKKRRQLGMKLQQSCLQCLEDGRSGTKCSFRPLKSIAAGRGEFGRQITQFVHFFCRLFLIQRKWIARVLVDISLVSHSQFENFGSHRSFGFSEGFNLFLDGNF